MIFGIILRWNLIKVNNSSKKKVEAEQQNPTERNSPSLQSGGAPQDILLSLKRDLPADDDEEENSQTPALQAPAVVPLIPHPLWGRVHLRSLVICILVLHERSRTKVYELDVAGFHVDQHVFVFYVTVKYTTAVAVRDSFDDLKLTKLSERRDRVKNTRSQKISQPS